MHTGSGRMPDFMETYVMLKAPDTQTSIMGGSPVETLAGLVIAAVCEVTSLDYGTISPDLLAQLDRESWSWRTCQTSFPWAEPPLLRTLPAWGMAVSGSLFRLTPLAARNIENAGSLWVTPTATDTKVRTVGKYIRRKSGHIAQDNPYRSAMRVSQHVKAVEQELATGQPVAGELNPRWVEMLMGLPPRWASGYTVSRQVPGGVRIRTNPPGLRRRLRAGRLKLRHSEI